jgi:menaquinone-dependent protoporphyrinogen IX oxidase
MKVCILYAAKGKDSTAIKKIATALAKGIEQQNHMVDLVDIKLEGAKIVSFYDYLIVGTEAITTFGGKIPESVTSFLKNSGSISGKRCMAFVTRPGIRATKTLQALMKVMESEGLYLKTSDIIKKEDMAIAIGKRIHIEAN